MSNLRLKTAKGKTGYHRHMILPQANKNPLNDFKLCFVMYSDRD